MNIGVDLDEVTVELLDTYLKEHYQKTGKLHTKNEFKEYEFWPVLNMPKEQVYSEVEELLTKRQLTIPPVEGAIDSIKRLQKKNKVIIITSRNQRQNLPTKDYLNHYFKFPLMEVVHSGDVYQGQSRTKAHICKEKNVSILIEDMKSTAVECANQGIKVILFDKPWNQGIEHDNIIRVEGWNEAMKELDKIQNQPIGYTSISSPS